MSAEQERAVLLEGPFSRSYPGRDVVAWVWFVNGYEVTVEIAQTAYEVEEEALSDRVRNAKRSQGRSEIERMSDWDVPNPQILLTTEDD